MSVGVSANMQLSMSKCECKNPYKSMSLTEYECRKVSVSMNASLSMSVNE